MTRRRGITWQRRKQLCKSKGCHNERPAGKDLCRACWKLTEACRAFPDPQKEQCARDRERSAEDAEETRELGA